MSALRLANNEAVTIRNQRFVDGDGNGLTGLTPTIRLRRESDTYHWNGTTFVSGVQTLTMTETDSTNYPGDYHYNFSGSSFCEILITSDGGATAANRLQEGSIICGATAAGTIPSVVIVPPASPSLCAVVVFPSVNAVSGGIQYLAEGNQVIGGVMLDVTGIQASVVDNGAAADYYRAELVRNARYRFKSNRFYAEDVLFTVPDAASVNLADLLQGLREV